MGFILNNSEILDSVEVHSPLPDFNNLIAVIAEIFDRVGEQLPPRELNDIL